MDATVLIITALIAAIPPTLSVAVAYQAIRRHSDARGDAIGAQLSEIHVLVNSRLEEALKMIAKMQADHLAAGGSIPATDEAGG